MSQAQPPSPQERQTEQRKTDANREALGGGIRQLDHLPGADEDAEDLLEGITSIDIDRDYADGDEAQHNIDEMLAPWVGRQLMLGNNTADEVSRQQRLDDGRRSLSMMEFARPQGLGSMCRGDTRRRITGDPTDEYNELSDDLAQSLSGAWHQISTSRTTSIGGLLLKRLLEAYVVTENKGFESGDNSSGGAISRLKSALGGG